MYKTYNVILEFDSQIHGGVPLNPEKVEIWRKALGDQPDQMEATKAELENAINEVVNDLTCGFRRGDNGLYIGDFQISAMLKESGESLRRAGVQKITSYRQRIGKDIKIIGEHITNNPLYGPVYGVYLTRNGDVIKEPDGQRDGLVHTAMIDALKRSEYVNPPAQLRFQIKITGNSVSEKELRELLEHGGEFIGQASDRRLGCGRFHLKTFEAAQ